jgi:hypothetical protein
MRRLACIAWAALLALPLLVAASKDIAAWRLTQDAVQAAEVPAWTGALATVGLLG